ncbi:MAG: site-specific integrase [Patescibacteria group bacterium]
MRIINIIYDQIIKEFLSELKSSGLSQNSIKFYKSDISSFISWFKLELRKTGIFAEEFKDLFPFIKPSISKTYKEQLILNNTPTVTINRKLSTLRRFSAFLRSKEFLPFDFAKNLQNIPVIIHPKSVSFHKITDGFRKHLEENKASNNTIKNYLADIHHFLNWINSHHATT